MLISWSSHVDALISGKTDTKSFVLLNQGKFIRIHFGTSGKLASADIETCKLTN